MPMVLLPLSFVFWTFKKYIAITYHLSLGEPLCSNQHGVWYNTENSIVEMFSVSENSMMCL